MSLLDTIKAQGGRAETRTLDVPEWGKPGAPLVIHYRRPNLNHLAAAIEAGHAKNPIRQNVDVLCQIAMDGQGKPLFRRLDAVALMEDADPVVLGRVMRDMGIIDGASEAELEKN